MNGLRRRLGLLVLLAGLGLAFGAAAPTGSTLVLSRAQLAGQVKSLVEGKRTRSIRWGICIARADTGEIIFTHNADELFLPASNRKLFVTALALDRLGPDFRFSTPLYLSSPLSDDGRLRGNLIVKGTGDPTFLNSRFHGGAMNSTLHEWADSLWAIGLRDVAGDLLMDGSHFTSGEEQAEGWIKDYETAEYAPRVSAICIAGNRVTVNVRPGVKPGQPPLISLAPPNSIVKIDNLAMTGPSRSADTIAIERAKDGPDHLVVRGRIAVGASEQAQRVPLEQPDLVAGEVFRSALEKKGIAVRGVVRALNGETSTSSMNQPGQDSAATQSRLEAHATDTSPAQWVRVTEYQSPPLREIMAVTNKHSDNYCAEQLFQAVAFAKTGRASYAEAKKFEEEFLAQVGILPEAANFEDGCGLSRLNLVSPRAVVRLLCHMAGHKNSDEFVNSLAVAGRDGTLAGRMGKRALGRVYAKTGVLSMASCLSGYVETRSGVRVAFSILANECGGRISEATAVQDRICEWLVNTSF
jgi:D-alanyl-D-alanine carboxypeptidase/D-alanyl-D-alanine-endopeptidase (penicillin-binding protein 4)